jgi:hypothetical protein
MWIKMGQVLEAIMTNLAATIVLRFTQMIGQQGDMKYGEVLKSHSLTELDR